MAIFETDKYGCYVKSPNEESSNEENPMSISPTAKCPKPPKVRNYKKSEEKQNKTCKMSETVQIEKGQRQKPVKNM